jgi:hypothetical protein
VKAVRRGCITLVMGCGRDGEGSGMCGAVDKIARSKEKAKLRVTFG